MQSRSYSQYLWLVGALLVAGLLATQLAPILAPFMMAAILAYICDPLVDRLERRRIPRTIGTLLVLALLCAAFVALLLVLLPLFYKEATMLAERIPGFIQRLNTEFAPWIKAHLGVELQIDAATVKRLLADSLQSSDGLTEKLLSSVKVGGLAVISFLVNLLLVPVVLFYLLRDWDRLVEKVDHMIPRRWHGRVTTIAREVDQVLAEFLRGQISVMLIMAVYYTFALWLTGLDFALPIGMITGLLVFVPYLGSITGLVLATIAGLMQFDSVWGVVWVWGAIGIGRALEGMLVTPWLVGDRIGLHPVAVIFALLAFGQVFGFFGVLLALPASAALLVWLRHLREEYVQSELYRPLMRQLVLELAGRWRPALDNFVAGGNAEALAAVGALARGEADERILYLWGDNGSGKSHLLRAAVDVARSLDREAMLIAPGMACPDPTELDGALLAVDDVPACDASTHAALFSAINLVRERGGAVLASGPVAPSGLALRADLATRLSWGLVFGLRALSDEEKTRALSEFATARGFALPAGVSEYLMRHGRRDLPSLFATIEALDRVSLERHRPVTVPLVRELLQLPLDLEPEDRP